MNIVPCIAGIDGGTKTKMWVTDLDMNPLCAVSSDAVNLCSADEAALDENLRDLFSQAESQTGLSLDYRSVVIGTAGVSQAGAAATLERKLRRLSGCGSVTVVGDMIPPLFAYAPEGSAQILVAGTGSVCYGKDASGRTSRIGGWGHIFGDEGSAYWIACRALDACLRAYDHRSHSTALTNALLDYFNCQTPEDLVTIIYSGPFDKNNIAAAAVYVAEVADSGDETAAEIQRTAARHLIEMSEAVTRTLGPPDVVWLNGGVLVHNRMIRQMLLDHLSSFTEVKTVQTDDTQTADAAWGAVILAKLELSNKKRS